MDLIYRLNQNRTFTELDISSEEFGSLVICAIRYCIGRRTYMPHVIIDFVSPLIGSLSSTALNCINRDISQAINTNSLGDEIIDTPAWKKFYDKINEELNERKTNGN